MSEWQPIETAPRDKNEQILLGIKGSRWVAAASWEEVERGRWAWSSGHWKDERGLTVYMALKDAPTHWQPLPEPPK